MGFAGQTRIQPVKSRQLSHEFLFLAWLKNVNDLFWLLKIKQHRSLVGSLWTCPKKHDLFWWHFSGWTVGSAGFKSLRITQSHHLPAANLGLSLDLAALLGRVLGLQVAVAGAYLGRNNWGAWEGGLCKYIMGYTYILIYLRVHIYIYIYICVYIYVYIYMPDILVINRMLSLYYNYWYHNPYQEYHGNFSMDSEWNLQKSWFTCHPAPSNLASWEVSIRTWWIICN